MNVVALVHPGCGRQGKLDQLRLTLRVPLISIGAIFRERRQRGLDPDLDLSKPVPDEIVAALLRERLAQGDTSRGVILDGYPGSAAQAAELEEILEELERQVDLVLVADVTDEAWIDYVRKRTVSCGHAHPMPSNEEVLRVLRDFRERVESSLTYYRGSGALIRTDDWAVPGQLGLG